MMNLEEEAIVVRKYSGRYDRAFFRLIGSALEWADFDDISAIKNAFPEWWLRCLQNAKLLEERGRPLE